MHLDGGEFSSALRALNRAPEHGGVAVADIACSRPEGDEDGASMRFFVLMEERADRQVAFEIAEGLFDGRRAGVVFHSRAGSLSRRLCATNTT